MKITVFNSSQKAEKSNTHVLTSAFMEGAESAGASVEEVFLAKKAICHCIGCMACWFSHPGLCVQKDDMAELLEKILQSDVIVFATPLYVDNVNGVMKQFMDRIVPIADPHWERDKNGECRHRKLHERPARIMAISNSGFPEQTHFEVLRVLFRRMARNLHCDLAGEIYRGAGGLLKTEHPLLKKILVKYLESVKQAGRELVLQGSLSNKTQENLEKSLVPGHDPAAQYLQRVNEFIEERLSKISGK